jgi:hypothetical protein
MAGGGCMSRKNDYLIFNKMIEKEDRKAKGNRNECATGRRET